jgi:hypothetical protein
LPEDEQTSNHGGGGRYDAILEIKGSKLRKKLMRKKKKKMRKREKEKEENEKEKERKRGKIYI